MNKCKGSTVSIRTDIECNNHKHAGTIVHVCMLDEHGQDTKCKCICGTEWEKNFK